MEEECYEDGESCGGKVSGEAGGLCDRQPCFDGERRVYEVCGEWDLFAVWAVEEDLQED